LDCLAPDSPPVRRRRAKFGNAGLLCPARWNPYVVAWWAAAFPGLSRLLLSRYVRGLVFSVWEIAANSLAHINQAMAYTFCGRCDDAREVLPLVLRPDGSRPLAGAFPRRLFRERELRGAAGNGRHRAVRGRPV
jgi:hypothetical protein